MPAARKLFVNLPVEDVDKSITFFDALGFGFDDDFTDEQSACVVINEGIYAMLLARNRFADFATKAVTDPRTHTGAILAIEVVDEDEVDRIADAALANGGSPANEPMAYDFMYGRSFFDPDGHMWEVFWLDPDGGDEAA